MTATGRPPIVTVPERSAPSFRSAVTVTRPPPDTGVGSTPIHVRSSLAGQLQSPRPATDNSRVPPDAGNRNDLGDTPVGEDAQEPASWMTATGRPPIVTVPERSAPSFRSAVTVTRPPPDTGVGSTPIHVRSSLAGQLQSPRPATDNSRVPPDAGNRNDLGDTPVGEDAQEPASWMTATGRPPIVTVPERSAPSFRSAVTVTRPPPGTVVGSTPIHVRSSLTDQLQSRRPATDTSRVPPDAGNRNDLGDTPVGEVAQEPASWMTATLSSPIVTVPDRAEPSFAVTLIVTGSIGRKGGIGGHSMDPAPDSGPPPTDEGNVSIQGSEAPTSTRTLLHGRSSARYNTSAATVADPAPLPNDTDVGVTDTIGEQFGGAACDTVTGIPPIVTVPDRASPGFRVTSIVRLPPADTLAGVLIQVWSALTGQLQPLSPVTDTLCSPPATVKLNSRGDTRDGSGQCFSCVTVNVAPASVRVPVRLEDPV